MTDKADLESKSLAELHALAAEAGVPNFRKIRREQLVEKLLSSDDGAGERAEHAEEPEKQKRPRRRRRIRRGGAPTPAEGDVEEQAEQGDAGAAPEAASTSRDISLAFRPCGLYCVSINKLCTVT